MVHNDKATLITLMADGSTVDRIETSVWCTKKSVNYKEFYAAVQVGMIPTDVFEVDIDEYIAAVKVQGDKKIRPTELIFDGEKMNIIRTYEKVGGIIELTVSL